jgi:four helix bundle protein
MRNVLKDKSYKFATRIVMLSRHLRSDNEYDLGRQIIRSGTSIGALVREAEYAQSRADFVNKLSIALEEANETGYWLASLKDGGYISTQIYDSLYLDVEELIRLLLSIVKTSKAQRKVKS